MYAVFGVTKSVAKAKALKDIEKKGWSQKQFDTYDQALAAKVDLMFSTMGASQLSALYSNRSEAARYAELAQKDGARGIVIKKRVKTGFDEKKQKDIISWACA